jgi:hypothetical protein
VVKGRREKGKKCSGGYPYLWRIFGVKMCNYWELTRVFLSQMCLQCMAFESFGTMVACGMWGQYVTSLFIFRTINGPLQRLVCKFSHKVFFFFFRKKFSHKVKINGAICTKKNNQWILSGPFFSKHVLIN